MQLLILHLFKKWNQGVKGKQMILITNKQTWSYLD